MASNAITNENGVIYLDTSSAQSLLAHFGVADAGAHGDEEDEEEEGEEKMFIKDSRMKKKKKKKKKDPRLKKFLKK